MLRRMLLALVIAISLTSAAGQNRARPTPTWRELYKDFPQQRLPIQNQRQYLVDLRRNFEDFMTTWKSNSRDKWRPPQHKSRTGSGRQTGTGIEKRGECDFSRITLETILLYLRTGRICGFRVTTVRFGLGGRK